tara:strand:+ start:720257 stop:720610 length:354 start_codon:yes stop_codon:yes gene_type:complete
MSKIKPSKNTSIPLLASLFNSAYTTSPNARGHKTLNESIQSVLESNQFDIQTPLAINTADEYTMLFTAVFNNAAINFVTQGQIASPLAIDIEANKIISYLEGNKIIKIAKPLTQHIY